MGCSRIAKQQKKKKTKLLKALEIRSEEICLCFCFRSLVLQIDLLFSFRIKPTPVTRDIQAQVVRDLEDFGIDTQLPEWSEARICPRRRRRRGSSPPRRDADQFFSVRVNTPAISPGLILLLRLRIREIRRSSRGMAPPPHLTGAVKRRTLRGMLRLQHQYRIRKKMNLRLRLLPRLRPSRT